jgi:hypothetical protein
MRSLIASLFLLVSLGLLSADELRTLTAKNLTGTLTTIADGKVILDTPDGPVTTPLAQVLAIDLQPAKGIPSGAQFTDVRLIDDTVLHCQEIRFEGESVSLKLLSGTALKLPVASIHWLVRGAEDGALRKKFEEMAAQRKRQDRVIILSDRRLNPLEGALGDVSADGKTIKFKREGVDAINVQIERLHGIIFYRPEGPAESPTCKVYDQTGNVIAAVKVAYQDKVWQLTTTFGAKLPLPEGAVAKLDFNMGKLTYLSDIEPTKVIERSGIGLVVKHKKDANLDGEPILLDRRYDKGLSMHAHTELEFNLGGKYKDLKGMLGIDTRTGADSQPLVSIYCDGEKRFSETITPKSSRPINLKVKDVGTLKIVVSSRNELDLHDHVTFAEARVSQ